MPLGGGAPRSPRLTRASQRALASGRHSALPSVRGGPGRPSRGATKPALGVPVWGRRAPRVLPLQRCHQAGAPQTAYLGVPVWGRRRLLPGLSLRRGECRHLAAGRCLPEGETGHTRALLCYIHQKCMIAKIRSNGVGRVTNGVPHRPAFLGFNGSLKDKGMEARSKMKSFCSSGVAAWLPSAVLSNPP